ncbi:hypothetical protein JCM21714_985 [Gracilibacillus boraciitolerans JCM 21714]|uniref:Uncharacterized protein n=1 Tax=Gracilibacillus boraciitolerans JCM 21714 TaxID=1298598 RepID=W4VGX8_9BACI|nr:hypothetical protein [Gracilibacillus boraciitolerans]GAE92009.1 hypothetical protein JCM21714_985 [Gracilibacillus boraciitolerans JCM 21714]
MKQLWATLKTMSFKEAADYIWEYYKLHIIGTILGVAFLVSILTTAFSEKEELYELMVVTEIPYDVTEEFSNQLNEQYFSDFRVATDNIISNGGTLSEQSYEQVQKLVARIATGMIDAMVTDKVFAQELMEQEGLLEFNKVIDVSLLEEHGVELYQFGSENVYGISTNQLDVFNDNEAFQDRILIIPASSKNLDKTTIFLEALLES